MAREGVTHVVMLGEQRDYHKAAATAAAALGARVIATDFGYLRPDWIAFEYDGLTGASHMPKTADGIRALAESMPACRSDAAVPGPVLGDGESGPSVPSQHMGALVLVSRISQPPSEPPGHHVLGHGPSDAAAEPSGREKRPRRLRRLKRQMVPYLRSRCRSRATSLSARTRPTQTWIRRSGRWCSHLRRTRPRMHG